MAGKNPNKSSDGEKVIGIITIPMAGAVVLTMAILLAEDAEDVAEAAVIAVGFPSASLPGLIVDSSIFRANWKTSSRNISIGSVLQ
jgi:hypothetical protein